LGKQRPTPPRKTRTREHVLADLSIIHVERQVLLCGFSVERTRHDYGYDLTMATYNAAGEIEPGAVYLQVKATDRLPRAASSQTIPWTISRRDLKLWLEETYPVLLVVYDGQKEKAYWLDIQDYFSARQTSDLFTSGETIGVQVPLGNRLTRRAIQAIARRKNELHQQLRGKRPHHA
jgi:hypothetical protein